MWLCPDRMILGKTKLVVAKPKSTGAWQHRRVGEGRFAAITLVVAALTVVLIWSLWRPEGEAASPTAEPNGRPVRIGLVSDSTHVRLIAYGGFDLFSSAGRAVFTCAGPNVLRFSAAPGSADAAYYYVVIFDMEKRSKPMAFSLLAALRDKYKVGSEVLEVSQRLILPRDRAGQGDRLVVAVGPFEDLKLAEQWKQYLSDFSVAGQWLQYLSSLRLAEERRKYLWEAHQVYIVKDTGKRASGEIHLYDHSDQLLARMKDSLTIRLHDDRQTLSVEALQSSASGWSLRRRTTPRHQGSLEIRLNAQGRLTAVNTLPLETYVNGVVPSEIGGGAPYEALKAQAIAARSEAYHKLGGDHHNSDLYDFCDGTHCQKYLGVEEQTAASLKAVTETRGQVLMYQNQVIDAVYCHSCGGVSADSADVWRSPSFRFFHPACDQRYWRNADLSSERSAASWLKSQPDVYCNPGQRGFPDYAKKYFRWTRRMEGTTLQRRVNSDQNVGQILDVQVLERGNSGRVRALRVVGSKSSVRYTGLEKICGLFNDLPSSFFVLEVEHTSANPRTVASVTIRGGGFGHGVGMCQMGAFMMAYRGFSCSYILQHYYPETSISTIY